MSPDEFTPSAPGQLDSVEFYEKPPGHLLPHRVALPSFVPNPLPPVVDWRELKATLFDKMAETLLALGKVNGLHKRVGQGQPLLRTLWIREAKLSSAVENIHTTALDMMIAATSAPTKTEAGLKAWKYVQALEHGIASALPFSARLIKEMHRILLEGVPPEDGLDSRPGEYRTIGVYIGNPTKGPRDARFVPPPPGRIDECMQALERFVNAPHADIPPLVCIALMHYQFETIHPFRDGNGRIGRVLISRSLVVERLLEHPVVYFSAYIYKNKDRYVHLLKRVSTHGDWIAWTDFILDAVLSQAQDAIVRSERLIDLHEDFVRRLKADDAPARHFKLVDRLFMVPVLDADEARETLDVQKPTTYRDIAALERLGILTEITGQSRDRIWAAKGVLDVIESENPAAPIDA